MPYSVNLASLISRFGGLTDKVGADNLWGIKIDPSSAGIATLSASGLKIVAAAEPQIAVQIGNPINQPPSFSPRKGDEVIQTVDGTKNSQTLNNWTWDGVSWILQSSSPTGSALAAPNERTYYTKVTAFNNTFPVAIAAATLPALGFTAVGGAGVAGSASAISGSFAIAITSPQIPQTTAGITTSFTPPTQYVRHRVIVTPGVDNSYGLRLRRVLDPVVDVWVCNQAGTPIRRLASQAMNSPGGVNGGNTCSLGPDEGWGIDHVDWEWQQHIIPKDLVDANRDANNIIQLALRIGIANSDNGANSAWIGGFGMSAVGNSSFANTCAMAMARVCNGGTSFPLSGSTGAVDYCALGINQIISGIRIALPGIDKDIYLTAISPCDLNGYEFRGVEFTILNATTGNLFLGRPRPTQVGDLSRKTHFDTLVGRGLGGFKIPASVLANKAVLPTNSGVYYLEIGISNKEGAIQYLNAITTETV
jgi:hypothetical protein